LSPQPGQGGIPDVGAAKQMGLFRDSIWARDQSIKKPLPLLMAMLAGKLHMKTMGWVRNPIGRS
jgi:hypothetical protein